MHPLLSLLPLLPLLLPATHATPNPGLPGAVYTCAKPNFSGACGWTAPSTECRINGGIGSIGPDQGGFCTLYEDQECTKEEGNIAKASVAFPGMGGEGALPVFGSFDCRPMVCVAGASAAGCP